MLTTDSPQATYPMCDQWTRWFALLTLLGGVAEFGLRLSTLQPKLRRCPWNIWPSLLWHTMLDDRIYLMGPFTRHSLKQPRPPAFRPPSPPALLLPILLGLSLTATPSFGATTPALRLYHVASHTQYGPVWPIAETDMRETIKTRLRERLPDITARLTKRLATYRVPAITRPTTNTAQTFTIDPSVTLTANLTTHEGKVLARTGDHVNPFTFLPLRRTYLIINGADPRQLAWVHDHAPHAGTLTTVLLTDGSLSAATAALPKGVQVFPAPAALFNRFAIDSVPARISRDHLMVRVDLIPESALSPYIASKRHERALDPLPPK